MEKEISNKSDSRNFVMACSVVYRRFQNEGVRLGEHLHWDILNLWREIKKGLSLTDGFIQSIGLDTWGVDFWLLNAAVPSSDGDFIYLSSRTWSLMGVLLDEPIINEESMAVEMANEGGVGEKIRFLKNIVGWLNKLIN